MLGAVSAADPEDAGAGGGLSGTISTRYRGRTTSGDDDHDLYLTILTDLEPATQGGWSFHLLGTLLASLGGQQNSSDVFFSLTDTREGDVSAQLYHAYAEGHTTGLVESVRVGRLLDYETPALAWFDGASISTAPRGSNKASAGLYGGLPVRAYGDSLHGDALVGVWGKLSAWRGARLRLDYMHVEDEFLATDETDDLLALGLWQTLGQELSLEGHYSHLDGDARDVQVSGTLMPLDSGLVLRMSYFRLLETQTQRTVEFDPFFETLLELEPYSQGRLLISQAFGEAWVLEAGADLRRLHDQQDDSQFNRDFDRVFGSVSMLEALPWDLEAQASVDSYSSDEDEVTGYGADLTKPLGRASQVALGTYYSLYKYSLTQNEERDHVRSYYLRWRRRLDERRRFDLRYELEDATQGEFHTFRIGYAWSF